MAKILNILRTVRNNWKKSMVGAAALSYGVSYSKDAYLTQQLMREVCEDIAKYGDAPLPISVKPRHVTVIINPAAKKRKARQLFEKYSEPLLHLAGIAVTVIHTTSNSQARNIVMNLDAPTDAIIVAGGDGTLSDVLTGLVRKYERNLNFVKQCPIGVLPLGETSKVANSLYQKHDDSHIQQIIDATRAIINNTYKMMDMVEIETIEEDSEDPAKPVYAMGSIEWGAWSDAHGSRNKYWYWGPLRKYVTYVFNGYKKGLSWDCDAVMKYTDPCPGCSQCYNKDFLLNSSNNAHKKWWQVFVPRSRTYTTDNNTNYSKVINESCSVVHEIPISTTELHIETSNVEKSESSSKPSSLKVELGPQKVGYVSFVSQGWGYENQSELLADKTLEAKYIELIPREVKDRTIYIDNEQYELKPIKVKLIPKSVKIFCP